MTDESRIKWQDLITRWKASGDSAPVFATREGVNASTLRWWAKELRREQAKPADAAGPALVQVVRKATPKTPKSVARTGSVIIDLIDAGVRIVVEPSADRATLATVLAVLGARRAA